ncbi:MAG TPA: hypothetical protein VF042_04345 [Gemmatimonadaceae bacterium]
MKRKPWQDALVLMLLAAGPLSAQSTVRIVPGPQYEASGIKEKLLGEGWRDLWLTPTRVEVLNLDTYAGGLKVTRRGGGNQTRTLRFSTSDGREILFRSVNKYPVGQAMPAPIRNSTLGDIIADQVATLFPAGGLPVPPLLNALGVLNVTPRLYVMPDDPRLGEFRKEFAGLLGTVEVSPQEDENDEPGFAGSRKIKSADSFLKDVEESRVHHLNERELFAIRLVDFLMNDNDRTTDNMRFARYGDSTNYTWRPLPRDRDRAFSHADGWLIRYLVHPIYPKLVRFSRDYDFEGLVFESYNIDRRLLQRLTRRDAQEIGERVKNTITNSVIEQAIATLPPEWRSQRGDLTLLRSHLRARRDRIPEVAMTFYDWLATEVDVHGTDKTERAVVDRLPDGRVTVTIRGKNEPATATPSYQRTFLPEETNEVRVYLHGGDDVGVVRGASDDAITVRLIGGGDDDFLADSAGGGKTRLYDEKGKNKYVESDGTRVSEKEWKTPRQGGGVRFDAPWRPDWGKSSGFGPTFDYVEGGGLVIGAGPRYMSYGFRRLPHRWKAGANVLVGTGNGRPGVNAYADYRFENSPLMFLFDARATRYEAFRFFGYGNNTPKLSTKGSRVNQDLLAIEPSLAWQIGWRSREDLNAGFSKEEGKSDLKLRPTVGTIEAGPVFLWNDATPAPGSPPGFLTNADMARAGVRAALDLDRTTSSPARLGYTFKSEALVLPPILDVHEMATTVRAAAATYVPIIPDGLHAAARIGGAAGWGDFAVQDAPYIGGRSSVRGYSARRFIGDKTAFGSVELRQPVGKLPLLINWDAGVFALADAGRVWLDGESPGGWHKAFGGGVWINALGQTLSAAFAHGDGNRFYLQKGMSF